MKILKTLCAIALFSLPLVTEAQQLKVSQCDSCSKRNQDIEALAEVIYFEARAEPKVGQIAVAYVVLNRTKNEEFPQTVHQVVNQSGQFSYKSDKIKDVITDKIAYQEAVKNAALVIDQVVPDPTNGAMYFKNDKTSKQRWNKRLIRKIGNHSFYA